MPIEIPTPPDFPKLGAQITTERLESGNGQGGGTQATSSSQAAAGEKALKPGNTPSQ